MPFKVEGQDEGIKISCFFVFIDPLTPALSLGRGGYSINLLDIEF